MTLLNSLYRPSPNAVAIPLPMFSHRISAGFPSPADDFIEKSLDLNELLVKHPSATFFVRVEGESMLGAGIHPDDILIVDRSLNVADGDIVVCVLHGELTVKRLQRKTTHWHLVAENPAYPDIIIPDDIELVIWGVATHVIHALTCQHNR